MKKIFLVFLVLSSFILKAQTQFLIGKNPLEMAFSKDNNISTIKTSEMAVFINFSKHTFSFALKPMTLKGDEKTLECLNANKLIEIKGEIDGLLIVANKATSETKNLVAQLVVGGLVYEIPVVIEFFKNSEKEIGYNLTLQINESVIGFKKNRICNSEKLIITSKGVLTVK